MGASPQISYRFARSGFPSDAFGGRMYSWATSFVSTDVRKRLGLVLEYMPTKTTRFLFLKEV